MTDCTVDESKPKRKRGRPRKIDTEDYEGACCLLVRESGSRRHERVQVLVDGDRIGEIAPFDWKIIRKGTNCNQGWYVSCDTPMRGLTGCRLFLHRFLTDPPKEMVVDHKNRKPLDNRSVNLRVCTHQQNSHNTTPPKNKGRSDFKGVTRYAVRKTKNRRRWCMASIRINGKNVLIGHFDSEEQAAYAYNLFAQEHRGDFAYLNPVTLTDDEIKCVLAEIEQVKEGRVRRAEQALLPPATDGKPTTTWRQGWDVTATELARLGGIMSRE